MNGDKYHVHYSIEGKTTTDPNGPWDTWADAKLFRDTSFQSFKNIQAAWITRFNNELGLKQESYGHTIKRNIKE